MDRKIVAVNGIRLHVLQEGSQDGAVVILLHGFPEFSYSWRKQIPYLAQAGYRVWAPDQRGYNLSDKPEGTAAYNLDLLAQDVVGLIDAAGRQQAYLVGHDWGGAVAWWVAAKYPQRLAKLVILNVPHGAVMQKNLRTNFAQMRRSWYMLFFQLPWLPEKLLTMANCKISVSMMERTSRAGTFSADELERYRQAWLQPQAYRSMLNWYRALFRHPPAAPKGTNIAVPTLIIWGVKESAFAIDLAQQSIDRCDDGRLVYIEDAGHWVQHEEAGRVNTLIGEFLAEKHFA